VLAKKIIGELEGKSEPKHDTSTNTLIARYKKQRG
jgi:hypothetical protein